MKKMKILLTLAAFLLAGFTFNACEKNDMKPDRGNSPWAQVESEFVAADVQEVFTYTKIICFGDPLEFSFTYDGKATIQIQQQNPEDIDEWIQIYQAANTNNPKNVERYLQFNNLGDHRLRYSVAGVTSGNIEVSLIIVDCDECEITANETAFGGDYPMNVGESGRWWYYFDTEGLDTQKIYAGQTIEIGTVTLFEDKFYIEIDSPWMLAPYKFEKGSFTPVLDEEGNPKEETESVKVQGYVVLPSDGFSPGHFEHKGTDLIVDVSDDDDFRYYIIHIDVVKCE